MKNIILYFFLIIACVFSKQIRSQSTVIEKEIYRSYKSKTIAWAKKQNPEEVEVLYVSHYEDSIFPNAEIVAYKNLKHLIVVARPLVTSKDKTIKDPIIIKVDSHALASLDKLEYLQLSQFDFRKFPMDLLSLTKLKALGLNNCLIQEIPEEISTMTQLEGLFLRQNNLADLPLAMASMARLKILDLANNQLAFIPKSILKMPWLEIVYLANYKGIKTDPYSWEWPVNLSVNTMDYILEMEALQTILRFPHLHSLHLQVNTPAIKRKVKNGIEEKELKHKVKWQTIDCGCGG